VRNYLEIISVKYSMADIIISTAGVFLMFMFGYIICEKPIEKHFFNNTRRVIPLNEIVVHLN
tara:strand:- start:1148 stop:1333 length:186 start_codon:yes stop_codon:yes gene_type:complete